ncbi:VOC family protein [Arthrobacter sp. ISL-30]|uniref:VOC family protein n=1 Tax=Arthrobacter sp. ISL-30 TaxID=2819109 RepID=UPI001BE8907F|nr:VOC family protein [Arthrobacter sp. ISL-30]MBT2513436.1 VOC family protein [Arthrobacter sp. ISL-30]
MAKLPGMTVSVTHLYAGVPVTDRAAALKWFEVFFGRPADEVIDSEALWQINESAWIFIDEDPDRAGHALLTLGVEGLDGILARLAAFGVEHEPVETYGNGVRHVVVLDPDSNRLSLAEAPPADPLASGRE